MKPIVCTALMAAVLSSCLAGCGSSGDSTVPAGATTSTTDTSGNTELNGNTGLVTSTTTSTILGQVMIPTNGPLPTTLVTQVVGIMGTFPVQSSGYFTITNIPIGSQTIQVVNTANNMVIDSVTVQVMAGTTVLNPFPPPA